MSDLIRRLMQQPNPDGRSGAEQGYPRPDAPYNVFDLFMREGDPRNATPAPIPNAVPEAPPTDSPYMRPYMSMPPKHRLA